MRRSLFIACLLLMAEQSFAGAFLPCAAAAVTRSAGPRLCDIRLGGHVAAKMNTLFAERLFGAEARGRIYDETVNAFRTHYDDVHASFGWSGSKSLPEGLWQGEYWGKTMLSAAVACDLTQNAELKNWLRDKARQFVKEFQKEDGYLSSYANPDFVGGPDGKGHDIFCWNLWGQKYTMWALIELSRVAEAEDLLVAATKMADNIIARLEQRGLAIEDTGYFAGLPSMSILKPLMLLYERTGKASYLAFARKLVAVWDCAGGRDPDLLVNAFVVEPVHAWRPHPERWAKAYEMMSCLEGLVAYASYERGDRILEAVRRIVEKLEKSELNAVGGVGFFDHFTHAAASPNATTEPCDVTHWIRVNRELFLVTGDAHYLDNLEFAFYNAFLAGVYRDGKWGAHSVRSHGTRHRTAPHQVGMRYHHCCVDNMPRTFVDFAATMVSRSPDGALSVNLYSPGSATLDGDKIRIEGDYPVGSVVKVHIESGKGGLVRFRLPRWFDAVIVNGRRGEGDWHTDETKPGGQDFVLEFVRTPRILESVLPGIPPVRADEFEFASENPEMKGLARTCAGARLRYGPLLLAKAKRMGLQRDRVLASDTINRRDFTCALRPLPPKGVWGAWTAEFCGDGERFSVEVCDFASAADWDDPGNWFSVWF